MLIRFTSQRIGVEREVPRRATPSPPTMRRLTFPNPTIAVQRGASVVPAIAARPADDLCERDVNQGSRRGHDRSCGSCRRPPYRREDAAGKDVSRADTVQRTCFRDAEPTKTSERSGIIIRRVT